MKIACLQFAPQIGDIDNNLNRADAVLNRANPLDLDDLDLLVLPELAFTGYNFHSLRHISPYLERSGSGISALWARAKALKYNCNVIVGYPEKVDVSSKWPTSPEYYNSAIIVNGDGETIANYRKTFLYPKDERWALEGKEGFFKGEIPGLGDTVLGICMDLNPYKFEAAWEEFEFSYHVLRAKPNLVVLSMSWITGEDPRSFSRTPQEPDVETLTYWVQRLEPVIRAETKEEIIVVFCNRCGNEEDMLYSGTSAVLGLKDGEVSVYGLLGRGVKELLVVDTEQPPFAKLVQRLVLEVEDPSLRETTTESIPPVRSNAAPQKSSSPDSRDGDHLIQSDSINKLESVKTEDAEPGAAETKPLGSETLQPSPTKLEVPLPMSSPKSALPCSEDGDSHRRRCGEKLDTSQTDVVKPEATKLETNQPPTSSPIVSPTSKPARKVKPMSPKLQIPYTPTLDEISSAIALSASTDYSGTGSMDSSNIPTPTAPSPIPLSLRPRMDAPSPLEYRHKATPYPMSARQEAFIYGGEVSITSLSEMMTPVTPFFDSGYTPVSPRLSFWRPSYPLGGVPVGADRYAHLGVSDKISSLRAPGVIPKDSELNRSASSQSPRTTIGKEIDSPKTAAPLTAIPLTAVPLTAFPANPCLSKFPDHSKTGDGSVSPKSKEVKSPVVPERLRSLARSQEHGPDYHATIPIAASPSVFGSFATPRSATAYNPSRELEFGHGIPRPPSKIPYNRERSQSLNGQPHKTETDHPRSSSQSKRSQSRLAHRPGSPSDQGLVADSSSPRDIGRGRQLSSRAGRREITGQYSPDAASGPLERKVSLQKDELPQDHPPKEAPVIEGTSLICKSCAVQEKDCRCSPVLSSTNPASDDNKATSPTSPASSGGISNSSTVKDF